MAKKWREELIEEMQHADKFTVRIIFLEGFPNMQVLDPLHIGQSVKEVLECDLKAENGARTLYQEAATYCASVKDYVSRDLFEELMTDEEGHIDFLETQLDLVEQARRRALFPASHRRTRRRVRADSWALSARSRAPKRRSLRISCDRNKLLKMHAFSASARR